MTQPNILFVFPDQWRGDWIGALSELPLRTPNVDALIARGVALTRAWTPSPLCAPARSALATAKAYHRAPVPDNSVSLPPGTPTLFSHLAQAGYQVGSVGKSDLLKAGHSWGGDGRHAGGWATLGFTHGRDTAGKHDSAQAARGPVPDPYTLTLRQHGVLDTYLDDLATRSVRTPGPPPLADWMAGRVSDIPASYANAAPSPLPEALYMDNYIGAAACEMVAGFAPDAPWFAMVNFAGPHEPLDITQTMADRWQDVDFPHPPGSPPAHACIRRRYAAMLEQVDHWLGRLLETIEARGETGRTLIIFASDHGEMLGERGLWQKQVPYEPSVHVPMVIAGPGVLPRAPLGLPANLIDLPVTLLAMAAAQPLPGADGIDLTGWLAGERDWPRRVTVSGLGAWRAVSDGRWKLVVGLDLSVPQSALQLGRFHPDALRCGQLYDLHTDPGEACDLWDAEPAERDRLLAALAADLRLAEA